MIGKIRYVGKDFRKNLYDGEVYDCTSIENDLLQIIDYECLLDENRFGNFYSTIEPGVVGEKGKWYVVEDTDGKLKSHFERLNLGNQLIDQWDESYYKYWEQKNTYNKEELLELGFIEITDNIPKLIEEDAGDYTVVSFMEPMNRYTTRDKATMAALQVYKKTGEEVFLHFLFNTSIEAFLNKEIGYAAEKKKINK